MTKPRSSQPPLRTTTSPPRPAEPEISPADPGLKAAGPSVPAEAPAAATPPPAKPVVADTLPADLIVATGPFPGVVFCRFCLFGQDTLGVSVGDRRCRGGTPSPHPTGLRIGNPDQPHARGVWPEVKDGEYCGAGKPLP